MTVVGQMLETYPKDLGGVDRQKLQECSEAPRECAQACTACSDVCSATGRVLSRHAGRDANLTRWVLEACAAARRTCGDECAQHADMHERCRVCAGSCHRCEAACRELISALG